MSKKTSGTMRVIFIAGVFFLCTPMCRADNILLKNGNVLEGEIITETDDAIVLGIFEGKGRTTVKKNQIQSVQKTPVKRVEPKTKVKSEVLAEQKAEPEKNFIGKNEQKIKILFIVLSVLTAAALILKKMRVW